jgi:tripartite-type tricarboxylate transporter receptor subunit TctC
MSETTRRQAVKLALSSLAVPFFPTPAITESKFPERPIRLIVPRAAGGPLDVIARQWAEQVKGSLGTVVVENMGGGGGSIGTVATARAAPDGYTIALLGAGELVVNPVIRPGSFDPVRDLAPINILANLTCGVAIAGNTPVRTLNEFVSYAKDKPGKMSYGSAGTGSMSHLAAELFKQIAGLLDLVHIPYKGSAPAFVDLMAGNINMMGFTLSGETIAMHKAGKIRILMSGTNQRIEASPDIPTNEAAGFPQFVAGNFLGFFAPAATPKPIVAQLAGAARQVTDNPAFKSKMLAQAYEVVGESDPAAAAKFIAAEIQRWTPVIKVAGLAKT